MTAEKIGESRDIKVRKRALITNIIFFLFFSRMMKEVIVD